MCPAPPRAVKARGRIEPLRLPAADTSPRTVSYTHLEGLALKDYARYLTPYYQAWMLAMLCLLGRGARARLSQAALGGAAAVLAAVFCWRGMPAAGFWTNADSLYAQRALSLIHI